MLPTEAPPQSIHHIIYDEYLQPKHQRKRRRVRFQKEQVEAEPKFELKLKLLEHPALFPPTAQSGKIQRCAGQLKEKLAKCMPSSKPAVNFFCQIFAKCCCSFKTPKLQLPRFLEFLRARNDDGLCKRKSGFEIYCEMASIHGFVNFVDAKTWQRVFWCLVIFLAMLMSTIILIMLHFMNVETPIMMYTESTHHPAWTIAFPAITICSMNRLSRRKSENLAEKFASNTSLTKDQILKLFHLSLYHTDGLNATEIKFLTLQNLLQQNNYSFNEFVEEISPNCESELLRCKWKGRREVCSKIFQKVNTPQGICCAFNYHALPRHEHQRASSSSPRQITSCGYKTGLTVLLNPHVNDYMAGLIKSYGYQVLIHDAVSYPSDSIQREFVQSGTETSITIVPHATYATDYVRDVDLHMRRCYFPSEQKLSYFFNSTQANCLTECRAKIIANTCGCLPWYLPAKESGIEVCDFTNAMCFLAHKANFHVTINETTSSHNYKENRYAENFICDCYPECSYSEYTFNADAGKLNRTFSVGDKRFFKGIQVRDHILLHVFYGDLDAVLYRLDVYENWLQFLGTFGGITGLYMGYSFVSGFEMIFFVFVRPLCNWLTKAQIRYKIKKRQKVAAANDAAKKAMELVPENADDKIETSTTPGISTNET